MRVLITLKSIDHSDELGGTETYYKVLRKYFSNGIEYFNFSFIKSNNPFIKVYRRLENSIKFIGKCLVNKNGYELIHLNPSLSWASVIRDGYFLLISKWSGKKTIIFFRGWHEYMVKKIDQNRIIGYLFKWAYKKADAFIVLSEDFKGKLHAWGFTQKVYVETTVVDNALLNGYINAGETKKKDRYINILFLARIEKAKGIYEAIEAYTKLKNKYSSIKLTIAGDGSIFEAVKSYVSDRKIRDIIFTGYVAGEDKAKVFSEGDIYIFPSYGEGMPNSVLEAMAFGLPVITRNVGGLRDFFLDGCMGYITESKEPNDFAEYIEKLILNPVKRAEISKYNAAFARKHFLASQVAKRLERIYSDVLSGEIVERSWRDEVG